MKKKVFYIACKLLLVAVIGLRSVGCQDGCQDISPNLLYTKINDIWVMQSNGQEKIKLLTKAAHPQWAPGIKNLIAFLKLKDGLWAIHTMDYDGKNVQNVKQLTDYTCGECYTWSPDRNWIVYETFQNNYWDIYKIKADGTTSTRLTNNTLDDRYPAWSPKGDQIVYSADLGKKTDIFVMDVDGNNGTNVTLLPDGYNALRPIWSPVDDKIAFTSAHPAFTNTAGYERLYIAETKKAAPNWIEISIINGIESFIFTPSGDYIIYNNRNAIYKQSTTVPSSAPQTLTSNNLFGGRMDVTEVNLFFQRASSNTSDKGLFSLTWRWKDDPSFREIQLDAEGKDPDY